MIVYFIALILSLLATFKLWFRLRYPFWSRQPVFHMHNLWWWLSPVGTISRVPPGLDRFVKLSEISNYKFTELPDSLMHRHVGFIRNFYMNTRSCQYHPGMSSYAPYFQGHSFPCFVSQYTRPHRLYDAPTRANVCTLDEIMGIMTTRPVFMCTGGRRRPVYYVDYLCVHSKHRGKDIATSLIHTHHYHQRNKEPKIHVSLFKREGVLMKTVPLCTFPTCTIEGKTITYIDHDLGKSAGDLRRGLTATILDEDKAYVLEDAIGTVCRRDGCVIVAGPQNMRRLLSTGNIHAVLATANGERVAVFFFRDQTCTFNGQKVVALIGTVCLSSVAGAQDFATAAAAASKKVMAKWRYGVLCVELLGDTCLWYGWWEANKSFEEVIPRSPTGYYLYNFAARPFDAKDVTIVM